MNQRRAARMARQSLDRQIGVARKLEHRVTCRYAWSDAQGTDDEGSGILEAKALPACHGQSSKKSSS